LGRTSAYSSASENPLHEFPSICNLSMDKRSKAGDETTGGVCPVRFVDGMYAHMRGTVGFAAGSEEFLDMLSISCCPVDCSGRVWRREKRIERQFALSLSLFGKTATMIRRRVLHPHGQWWPHAICILPRASASGLRPQVLLVAARTQQIRQISIDRPRSLSPICTSLHDVICDTLHLVSHLHCDKK